MLVTVGLIGEVEEAGLEDALGIEEPLELRQVLGEEVAVDRGDAEGLGIPEQLLGLAVALVDADGELGAPLGEEMVPLVAGEAGRLRGLDPALHQRPVEGIAIPLLADAEKLGRALHAVGRGREGGDMGGVVIMGGQVLQVRLQQRPEGLLPEFRVVPVTERVGIEPVSDREVAARRGHRLVHDHGCSQTDRLQLPGGERHHRLAPARPGVDGDAHGDPESVGGVGPAHDLGTRKQRVGHEAGQMADPIEFVDRRVGRNVAERHEADMAHLDGEAGGGLGGRLHLRGLGLGAEAHLEGDGLAAGGVKHERPALLGARRRVVANQGTRKPRLHVCASDAEFGAVERRSCRRSRPTRATGRGKRSRIGEASAREEMT